MSFYQITCAHPDHPDCSVSFTIHESEMEGLDYHRRMQEAHEAEAFIEELLAELEND